MEYNQVLRTLTGAVGVSGAEQGAAEAASELLRPYCSTVTINNRGSVVGRREGKGPLVLLEAHLDQIGFVVTEVAANGFVRFDACGGIDIRTLAGLEVVIHGTEDVYGIIETLPPHLTDSDSRGKARPCRELAIDTGLRTEHCRSIFHPGDRASFLPHPAPLLNRQVCAPALDNRAGVAALIRTAELVQENEADLNLCFLFSVQEEVGGKGAATGMVRSLGGNPPALALAVDVSFAWTPGCRREGCGELGKGPMIGYSPLLSAAVFQDLQKTAEEADIPFQLEIMNGRTGTHADELAVALGGVTAGLVSIPLKYMHTPAEVIDCQDVENTARLLYTYLVRKGGSLV